MAASHQTFRGNPSSISEVTLKKYSIGLSGNIINLCDYPEAVQNLLIWIYNYVHVIHIAIAGKNGRVFKFNDGHWNVVIDSQVHAFVFQNDIFYTDPQSHLSRNSRSETLTGTVQLVTEIDLPAPANLSNILVF